MNHRSLTLTLGLLACVALPAAAQDLSGTYESKGTHSGFGAFTGTVTITAGPGGRYDVSGTHTYTNGGQRAWVGEATPGASGYSFYALLEAPGIIGALDGNNVVQATGSLRRVGDTIVASLRSPDGQVTVTETLWVIGAERSTVVRKL